MSSRQTEQHTLPTGDYLDRLNKLDEALKAAEADESPRALIDRDPAEALRAEYAEVYAEMIEAATRARRHVALTAISRGKMRELKAKHPPRTEGTDDEVKGDRLAGMNLSSVEDDLVYATLVEPAFSSRADYDEWADELSEGEFDLLLQIAWRMANVAQFDPKSLPASPTPKSGETSD